MNLLVNDKFDRSRWYFVYKIVTLVCVCVYNNNNNNKSSMVFVMGPSGQNN